MHAGSYIGIDAGKVAAAGQSKMVMIGLIKNELSDPTADARGESGIRGDPSVRRKLKERLSESEGSGASGGAAAAAGRPPLPKSRKPTPGRPPPPRIGSASSDAGSSSTDAASAGSVDAYGSDDDDDASAAQRTTGRVPSSEDEGFLRSPSSVRRVPRSRNANSFITGGAKAIFNC